MRVLSIDPFVRLEEIHHSAERSHRFQTLGEAINLSDVEVILTAGADVSEEMLRRLPCVTEVITAGTGTDHLELSKLEAAGITVTNVPEYCTEEVSDHAVAMVCALFRSLPKALVQPRTAWREPCGVGMRRFTSTHVGVLGTGRIGRAVCYKLKALGMKVSMATRPNSRHPVKPIPDVGLLPLKALLPDVDALVVASPGSSHEPPVLDREALSMLRRDAFLVNISRASLVDLRAVQDQLQSSCLAGAFFDVWDTEPPNDLDALLRVPGLYLSPHNGWYSPDSEIALWSTIAARLDSLEMEKSS